MYKNSKTTIYCIDSSVIVDLWKERGQYPKDVFISLWENIEDYIQSSRMFSSVDVYEELRNDAEKNFKKWLLKNKKMFLDVDECQVKKLREILDKYPMLAQGYENRADPVLVSLSVCRNFTILTNERKSAIPSVNTPKIPNLCKEFGVDCVDIIGFCRKEKKEI